MGTDYDGGMIVGEIGSKLNVPKNYDGMFPEWADDNGMTCMSKYYDASADDCYFGFKIPNELVSELDNGWLLDVKEKAKKFEELTGVPAKLIGTQNIW